MQNVEMMIAQVCDDGEKIWFYDNIHHYICFSDHNFNEVHIEKKIDVCDVENFGTGNGIFKLEQKLYITFQGKVVVLIYSIETQKYHTILFDQSLEKNLYNIEKIQGNIFFLPQKVTGKLFKFNMRRENFEQKVWMNKSCIKSDWMACFLSRKDEKIFLPIYSNELLLELNLLNYKYIIHEYKGISIGSICHYKDTTWIVQTDSEEVVCIENQYLKKIYKYTSNSTGKREFFSKLFIYNEKVVGIPRFGDYVLIIDLKNQKVTHLYHTALKRHKKDTTSLTYGYCGAGDFLYLLPWGTLKLLCVDIEKAIIFEKKIRLCACDYLKYLYFNPGYEKDADAFRDYLNWIALKDSLKIKNEYEGEKDKCVGETIYETIKRCKK